MSVRRHSTVGKPLGPCNHPPVNRAREYGSSGHPPGDTDGDKTHGDKGDGLMAEENKPDESSMPSVGKQIMVMGIIVVGIVVVLGIGILLSQWLR